MKKYRLQLPCKNHWYLELLEATEIYESKLIPLKCLLWWQLAGWDVNTDFWVPTILLCRVLHLCSLKRDTKSWHMQGVGVGGHLIYILVFLKIYVYNYIYFYFAYELKSWIMRAFANHQTKFVETQNVFLKKRVWKTRQQFSHQQQMKELRKRVYKKFLKTPLSQSTGLVTICLHQNTWQNGLGLWYVKTHQSSPQLCCPG